MQMQSSYSVQHKNYKDHENSTMVIVCELNFIFFIKILKKQEKEESTTFVLLSYFVIGWFIKICLNRPMKIVQSLSHRRIQKCWVKPYILTFCSFICVSIIAPYSVIQSMTVKAILSIICHDDFKSHNTNFQRLRNLNIAPLNWIGVKRGKVS